jgi:hypothetical protein
VRGWERNTKRGVDIERWERDGICRRERGEIVGGRGGGEEDGGRERESVRGGE